MIKGQCVNSQMRPALLCRPPVLTFILAIITVHVSPSSVLLHASQRRSESQQSVRAILPQWAPHSTFRTSLLQHRDTVQTGRVFFYAQSREDHVAAHMYFHNSFNGVYLEMGALDGTLMSNTRYFEESRDWKGLLIEPNAEEFEHMYTSRPNAVRVNAAICAQKQTVHFVGRRARGQEMASAGVVHSLMLSKCWRIANRRYAQVSILYLAALLQGLQAGYG